MADHVAVELGDQRQQDGVVAAHGVDQVGFGGATEGGGRGTADRRRIAGRLGADVHDAHAVEDRAGGAGRASRAGSMLALRVVPIPAERRRSYLARQVATMVLSHVQVDTPMAIVRAAAWCNSLARMGVHLPLFVIHDIGVMLSMTRGAGGYVLRAAREPARADPDAAEGASRSSISTAGCSRTSRASEVTERLAGLRLRDEMVAVLLSRILGDTYNRWRDRSKSAGVEPLPLDPRHPRRDRLRRSLPRLRSARRCGASSSTSSRSRCTSTRRSS